MITIILAWFLQGTVDEYSLQNHSFSLEHVALFNAKVKIKKEV